MTVLVTSVASPTGFLLASNLRPFGPKIIGIDAQSVDFAFGEFYQCPLATDPTAYGAFLEELIIRFRVTDLYVCNDYDLRFLANQRGDFFEQFTLPGRSVISLFLNKMASLEAAEDAGLDVPQLLIKSDKPKNIDYFVRNQDSAHRPKIFRRMKGNDIESLTLRERSKFIVTEFISGIEYTADAYYDPKRAICEVAVRERVKVIGGVSTQGKLLAVPELEAKLRNFIKTYNIFGFSCTQFIERAGIFYYVETNTRPGGGTSISLKAGLMDRIQGRDCPLVYGQLINRG